MYAWHITLATIACFYVFFGTITAVTVLIGAIIGYPSEAIGFLIALTVGWYDHFKDFFFWHFLKKQAELKLTPTLTTSRLYPYLYTSWVIKISIAIALTK